MTETIERRVCDAAVAGQSLPQLHEFVTRTDARVEITRAGSDQRCVLLSKKELEALEQAIEILSERDDVRELSSKLAVLVAAASEADHVHA